MNNEPLAIVYEAPDEFMSWTVKNALENAGVKVIERIDRTMAYDNLDFSIVGRYSRLLTLESEAAKARQVVAEFLAAYQKGELELPE